MSKEKRRFNLRSFTSFTLVISTIIMSLSGFILYIAPPGRIANWGTWKLMFLTKSEWQALHTIFAYLFFILAIIHLFFVNWKTFLTYFKSKIRSGVNRKWELGTALFVSVLFFIGTLRAWTPFAPVINFGEKAKQSWEKNSDSPPVIHMELNTIQQVAILLDSIPTPKLIQILNKNNIQVTGVNETLKEVANNNNTTPAAIYKLLTSKANKQTIPAEGESPQGIGRQTVKSISKSSGKEISSLLLILKKQGIYADENTSVRTISRKLGMSPRDVHGMLTEE